MFLREAFDFNKAVSKHPSIYEQNHFNLLKAIFRKEALEGMVWKNKQVYDKMMEYHDQSTQNLFYIPNDLLNTDDWIEMNQLLIDQCNRFEVLNNMSSCLRSEEKMSI